MLLEKWLLTVGSQSAAPAGPELLYFFGYNFYGQLGTNNTVNALVPTPITMSWAQVVTGSSHTLALRSDNYLFAWGANDVGQLGDKTTFQRSSPVQLGSELWQSISTKDSTSYGIRSNGLLYAWGYALEGQLGTNNFNSTSLGKSWTDISAGDSHVIAIRSDGLLFAWGLGTSGQLGDGTTVSRSSQVQIGTSSWSSVAAGTLISLATRSDGKLFVWGLNTTGQLGLHDRSNRSSPSQLGTKNWIDVSAGNSYAAGIDSDNQLFVWGVASNGQIGNGIISNRSSPVQVTSLVTETQIENYAASLGINPYPYSWTTLGTYGFSTATFEIQSDGSLWASGDNSSGQLGTNDTDNRASPVKIGTSSWIQVVTNNNATSGFALALRSDGLLFAWGLNTYGQLGLEDLINRSSPTQIGTSSWVYIGAGGATAYAINTDGKLFAWGLGNSGQIGTGDVAARSSPIQVGTKSWAFISSQQSTVSGIDSNGVLFTWGDNSTGQLGIGIQSASNKSSPVQVTSLMSDADQTSYIATLGSVVTVISWSQIDAGFDHALAIRSDGMLFAWGDNTTGQLGTNDTLAAASPVMVGNSSWIIVSAQTASAAIRSDGTLWIWGDNTSGALGQNDLVNRSSPVQLGTESWMSISAGSRKFMGIRADGALFAWGENGDGNLGDNSRINKSSPVQIGTSSWSSVSVGKYSTNSTSIGIRSDGLLFTWGQGTTGEIGDGAAVARSSPVQVTSLSDQIQEESYATTIGYTKTNSSWSQVSVGTNNVFAIKNDGTLWSWGTNQFGQLGLNDTISTSSPLPVGTSSWVSVAAAASNTIALRSDGAIFVWGDNAAGQLGTNDLVSRSSPVQLDTNSWSSIAAKDNSIAAIRIDGALFLWGSNANGELGDNTLVSKSSPVQLGNDSWTSVSADNTTIAAIRSDGLLFAWGVGTSGQLGNGDNTSRSSPVQITSLSGNELAIDSYVTTIGYSGIVYYSWSQISTGAGAAAGITSDGMLWTWGAGASGQLGNNSTISASKPTMIGNSSWTSVSAGKNSATTNHMAAIRIDGGLFVWGDNTAGGLGFDDRVHRSSPTQVGTSSWTVVSAGFDNNTFAVRVDGALFTWGINSIYGVLGQNNTTVSKSSPVQIGTSSWITVSAGSFSAAAIRSDGGLFTWGANGVGQLGSGTLVHRSSPVQVGTSSWTQVSAGASSIAAIRSDGGLFTWGAGNYGGLGSNATLNRSSPVQVGTSSWVQVNASTFNMNARRVDGAVFSWGYNTGQIGDNTSVDRSSPVQLAAGSSYSVVGLGAAALATASAMFIRSDGRLFTAGNNLYGQLGIKTQGSASSPVAVSTINDSWAVVSTGNGVTAAIRNDNLLFMWGLGTGGALGANISTSRSSPVQIGTSSWSMVNAGSATLGRRVDGALFAWGLNTNGTVGDNTFINRSSPVQLGTNSWSMIAGSGLTSSAIRNDGILFLWGTGTQGQMGNYRFINYNSPIQLATMNDSWSVVSAGSSYMTAIRSDKLLFTWGLGTVGRLGDGTTITKSAPVQIGNSSWTSVSAGNDTTIAIRADNTLFTWGQGGSGQLGDGTLISKSSPIQIGTGSWGKISAGESFFGAIGNDGGLYMTGLNDVTQLGIVRNGNQSSPVLVKSVTDTWYKTSASNKDIFAIRSDKLLFGWGQNLQGMLGLGDAGIARSAPVQIGSSSWAQVSAGTSHTAALQYDGSLFVWGLGTSGQLGDSTIVSKSSPVQIGVAVPEGYYSVLFNGTTDYLQIANNVAFNFGTGDFTGECWFNLTADAATDGANQKIAYLFGPGQSVTSEAWLLAIRGNSTTTGTGLTFQSRNTSGTPTSLDATYTFSKNTWYHVAVSKSGSTLALFINGEKIAEDTSWTVTSNSGTSPFRIARRGVSANYEQYFPGYISNLRVLKGTGLYTSSFTPEGPLTAITDTQLLTCQSAAIKDNSTNSFTITTFGSTRTSTSSPFNSSTSLTGWYDVSAGNNFTMAIDSKYNLYAWGDNTYTQLGIVRYNGTSSPVIVKGINDNWKDVSVGSGQTGAIRSDDTLYTWGLGTSGQLGDSTIVSKSTPVQIGLNTPPDGYYSVSFNGTSNYLEIANSTNLILGTGDFTIEAWIYQTAWGKNRAIYSKTGTTVSSGTMFFGIDTSGKIIVELNSTTIFSGVNTIPLNTWTHVAWSRNSGTSYYFVNGNLDGSVSDTSDFFGTGASRIGLGRGNSTTFWSGQISNLRVLKGTGLYTSSFTPEGPLTAITNTQLLTCQSTTIKDNSINKFTITNN